MYNVSVVSFWGSYLVKRSSEQPTRISKWIPRSLQPHQAEFECAHTAISHTPLLTVMFQSMDSGDRVFLVSAAIPMTIEPIESSFCDVVVFSINVPKTEYACKGFW